MMKNFEPGRSASQFESSESNSIKNLRNQNIKRNKNQKKSKKYLAN